MNINKKDKYTPFYLFNMNEYLISAVYMGLHLGFLE